VGEVSGIFRDDLDALAGGGWQQWTVEDSYGAVCFLFLGDVRDGCHGCHCCWAFVQRNKFHFWVQIETRDISEKAAQQWPLLRKQLFTIKTRAGQGPKMNKDDSSKWPSKFGDVFRGSRVLESYTIPFPKFEHPWQPRFSLMVPWQRRISSFSSSRNSSGFRQGLKLGWTRRWLWLYGHESKPWYPRYPKKTLAYGCLLP